MKNKHILELSLLTTYVFVLPKVSKYKSKWILEFTLKIWMSTLSDRFKTNSCNLVGGNVIFLFNSWKDSLNNLLNIGNETNDVLLKNDYKYNNFEKSRN